MLCALLQPADRRRMRCGIVGGFTVRGRSGGGQSSRSARQRLFHPSRRLPVVRRGIASIVELAGGHRRRALLHARRSTPSCTRDTAMAARERRPTSNKCRSILQLAALTLPAFAAERGRRPAADIDR